MIIIESADGDEPITTPNPWGAPLVNVEWKLEPDARYDRVTFNWEIDGRQHCATYGLGKMCDHRGSEWMQAISMEKRRKYASRL